MVSTDGPAVKPTAAEVKQERLRRRKEARKESKANKQRIDRALVEFQPDAVEIEQRSVPGGARWTLYVVISMIIATVLWASWAEVDSIVMCTGKLRTIDEPILIKTAETAPVKSINVRFGDRVKVGQLIATMDATYSEADIRQLETRIKSTEATIARLQAEQDGVEFLIAGNEDKIDWQMELQVHLERAKEYDAKLKEFASETDKVAVQKENAISEAATTLKRVDALKKLRDSFKDLAARGSKSPVDVLSRELQVSEAEAALEKIKSRGRELAMEEDSISKRQAAFVASWRAQLAGELITATKERNDLVEELAKAQRSNELAKVYVPAHEKYEEFVVLEVSGITVGSVVQPGEPLFKLVPYDAPLECEIEIPGKDIARIRTGDETRVKINTFPFQKHGTLDGKVRTISYGAFEKQGPGGQPMAADANYIARVQLDQPIELEAVPEDFELVPGMTLTAEIKVGRRKVISYFLYPLIRYLDTSIREP